MVQPSCRNIEERKCWKFLWSTGEWQVLQIMACRGKVREIILCQEKKYIFILGRTNCSLSLFFGGEERSE